MKLSVTHTIDGPPAAFWSRYLDPAWMQGLHLETLGSTSADLVSQDGTYGDGTVTRTFRYRQQPELPGPLRRLVGAEVILTEHGTFDPGTQRWTFTLTPRPLGDKATLSGAMATDAKDDGTSELTFTLEARVKLIAIGGVAEKLIERKAREGQEETVARVNADIAAT